MGWGYVLGGGRCFAALLMRKILLRSCRLGFDVGAVQNSVAACSWLMLRLWFWFWNVKLSLIPKGLSWGFCCYFWALLQLQASRP
ncbi:hypothetical protein Acr_01g0015430 [Actinidia rufa]|uniref:Uncharacterized protein n=1 Tax=Actinidia rufa TaxID=165716 RepID=A0A7J0E5X0_9ERIC|nr:hypothetical protein Acr_01g0015430 [Actinidia rufa]